MIKIHTSPPPRIDQLIDRLLAESPHPVAVVVRAADGAGEGRVAHLAGWTGRTVRPIRAVTSVRASRDAEGDQSVSARSRDHSVVTPERCWRLRDRSAGTPEWSGSLRVRSADIPDRSERTVSGSFCPEYGTGNAVPRAELDTARRRAVWLALRLAGDLPCIALHALEVRARRGNRSNYMISARKRRVEISGGTNFLTPAVDRGAWGTVKRIR